MGFSLANGDSGSPLVLPVDDSGWGGGTSFNLEISESTIALRWPMRVRGNAGTNQPVDQPWGELVLNRTSDLVSNPLISRMGVALRQGDPFIPVLENLSPVTYLTIGTRQAHGHRTHQLLTNDDEWNIFFDKPYERPYETLRVTWQPSLIKAWTEGNRATVSLDGLQAGSFSGAFEFTVYGGGEFIHAEAVMSTSEDMKAIFYDAGLVGREAPGWRQERIPGTHLSFRASHMPSTGGTTWRQVAWMTTGRRLERQAVGSLETRSEPHHPIVRHRTIVAESQTGSVAVFPPPHQYFYPVDWSTNMGYVWAGRNFHGQTPEFGLGIRNHVEGYRGKWAGYAPWFNAPPGTWQRMGLFYLLSTGDAGDALQAVLDYTHQDRFPYLRGHQRFVSHFHLAHTAGAMARDAAMRRFSFEDEIPSFVTVFKEMEADIVHISEFHGDGNPRDKGETRLREMHVMHQECARLSDDEILILPGEEPNVHFGGHWDIIFPKPVYWIMSRQAEEPFLEQHPDYGTVYRVGNANEVLEMLKRENGLVWTAHPRIKASHSYPDLYFDEPFYLSDRFLGGAWKAMPADLSRPTLGERALDLLDDMSNRGDGKYIVGEVDVFKIDSTHELYPHMNVNYLRMDARPRFEEGWESVLEALRGGRFFVSTGEIVLPRVSIDGKESGETLFLKGTGPSHHTLKAEIQWTFPLRFAEIVSGDGEKIYRERIDLSGTGPFGNDLLTHSIDLAGRTWVRFEVWDIAANGAFTQPIWLRPAPVRQPSTGARFVPEREGDFAWENDLVAFRAYGPPLRESIEDSGIDLFMKRVSYPIIDKWYAAHLEGVSYHVDHGEGYDPYKVGASRGCGGTGIWRNGTLHLSNVFRDWRIISQTREKTVFELFYDYDIDDERIEERKRLTIELGSHFFHGESFFTMNGEPVSLVAAVGLTTHEGEASGTLKPAEGWMSCWELIDGWGLGTGVAMAPQRIGEMKEWLGDAKQGPHLLLLAPTDAEGRIVYHVGFGWERAGLFNNRNSWEDHLRDFSRSHFSNP